jgi:hypothetical protein
MKNKEQALNDLYESILSLSDQLAPRGENGPEIIPAENGNEERIEDGHGFVEAYVEDLLESYPKIGLRGRFRFVIVTVYNDDVDDKEFSSVVDAARYFLLESYRMRLWTSLPKDPGYNPAPKELVFN